MSSDKNPPNIIVLLVDDLGYGDVGCYGATRVQTPNMDRLASEGRRFTDAHAASAVCSPSRYAVLTGEYPLRYGEDGFWWAVFHQSGLVLDPQRPTVASMLQTAGYATACIGKWHLGFGDPRPDWNGELKPGPLEVGFDSFVGIPVVSSHPPFVYVENHRVLGLDPADPLVEGKGLQADTPEYDEKFNGGIGGAAAAHALYRDDEVGATLAARTSTWIRERAKEGRPFFLYYTPTHIHTPYTPGKAFQGTSGCGPYGDFIHELDWMVAELMDTLEESGVADNTLLIFTSDNGGMLSRGGQRAWSAGHRLNGDLLGFKFGAWEGGHRVPFIVRWPGRIEPGTVSDSLLCHVDLYATIAALLGHERENDEAMDSVNLLPALTGKPGIEVRDQVLLAPREPTHLALRVGDWVYIPAQGEGGFQGTEPGDHTLGGPAALRFTGQANSDIVNGEIKPDAPPVQLYNLRDDFAQARNVARERPDVLADMRRKWDAIRNKARSGIKTAD